MAFKTAPSGWPNHTATWTSGTTAERRTIWRVAVLCGGPSAQTADQENWSMMTDDERTKLERMLQHDDDGSRKLAHMLKLLTELRSVVWTTGLITRCFWRRKSMRP